MTYLAFMLLRGLLTSHEYSPLSFSFRLSKDSTLFLSERVVFTPRVRAEPLIIHSLVQTDPAASQVKLREFPSISRFVDGVIEAFDMSSVG